MISQIKPTPILTHILTAERKAAPPNVGKTPISPSEPKTLSKGALVEQMLATDGGITIAALCKATGWLPHTSRAFLTGLRKKGRALERFAGADGKTLYRIAGEKVVA